MGLQRERTGFVFLIAHTRDMIHDSVVVFTRRSASFGVVYVFTFVYLFVSHVWFACILAQKGMIHKSALLLALQHECDHHVQIIVKMKDVNTLECFHLWPSRKTLISKVSTAKVNIGLLFIVRTGFIHNTMNSPYINPYLRFLMHHILK